MRSNILSVTITWSTYIHILSEAPREVILDPIGPAVPLTQQNDFFHGCVRRSLRCRYFASHVLCKRRPRQSRRLLGVLPAGLAATVGPVGDPLELHPPEEGEGHREEHMEVALDGGGGTVGRPAPSSVIVVVVHQANLNNKK